MAERYATAAQVLEELPEVANITYWTASSNAKIITQENFASAEVDSRLRGVYSTPFSSSIGSTPVLIQKLTALVTARMILSIEYKQGNHNVTNWKKEIVEEIKTIVNELLSGTMSLVSAAGIAVTRLEDVSISTSGQDPVFGMGVIGEHVESRDDWDV